MPEQSVHHHESNESDQHNFNNDLKGEKFETKT